MIKRLESAIQKIQSENWGFPWHVSGSSWLVPFFTIILTHFSLNPYTSAGLSVVIALVLGIVVEYRQGEVGTKGSKQDIIGNAIGIAIGAVLTLLTITAAENYFLVNGFDVNPYLEPVQENLSGGFFRNGPG